MIRPTSKTKLSRRVTSYRFDVGVEELNENESLEERYKRHLDQMQNENQNLSGTQAKSTSGHGEPKLNRD